MIINRIIYGGSFNPPTIAHYEIARFIINKYPKAVFEFLPANNFYKINNQGEFYHRVKMLELISKKLDSIPRINLFEISLDKYYGTDYTLKHFNDAHFLMGADNLATIDTWINYPNVVINNRFIIMPRSDIDMKKLFLDNKILNEYQKHFILIEDFDLKFVDISSTLYRSTLNNSYLLEEVAKYIKDNNLYKESNR